MSHKGLLFDIKEFAVYDGPGIRTTVFMKGCPLRCQWCHNPEGLMSRKQIMVSTAACTHCGACSAACEHDVCIACGKCIPKCKAGLRKICGEEYTPEQLAQRLLKDRSLWEQTGGGVTFSGGEPLMQWEFVREVCDRLQGCSKAIETSGCADESVFRDAVETMDYFMMDLKLMDPASHAQWIGVKNDLILKNARALLASQTPCIIRVPLIPGVNDTERNLTETARFVQGAKNLVRVELLPYHKTAGAKYEMAGMHYQPSFDTDREPNKDASPFLERGIEVSIL